MAANDPDPRPRRLIVIDVKTKKQYLIDTGSDISVYPRNLLKGPLGLSLYQLFAANNTIIRTYGQITLELNLGLRHNS